LIERVYGGLPARLQAYIGFGTFSPVPLPFQ
jgi:hypothetical protein